jgi:hypothetical protein
VKQLTVLLNIILCIRSFFSTKHTKDGYYSFKPGNLDKFFGLTCQRISFLRNADSMNFTSTQFEHITPIYLKDALATNASFAFLLNQFIPQLKFHL